jgi:hypothetical protein
MAAQMVLVSQTGARCLEHLLTTTVYVCLVVSTPDSRTAASAKTLPQMLISDSIALSVKPVLAARCSVQKYRTSQVVSWCSYPLTLTAPYAPLIHS